MMQIILMQIKDYFSTGKFTTVDASGSTGNGQIIIEGAHDLEAGTGTMAPIGGKSQTQVYIESIERLEGSATIVGKALE